MRIKYEAPAIEIYKFSLNTGVYALTASETPENNVQEGSSFVTIPDGDPFSN